MLTTDKFCRTAIQRFYTGNIKKAQLSCINHLHPHNQFLLDPAYGYPTISFLVFPDTTF